MAIIYVTPVDTSSLVQKNSTYVSSPWAPAKACTPLTLPVPELGAMNPVGATESPSITAVLTTYHASLAITSK